MIRKVFLCTAVVLGSSFVLSAQTPAPPSDLEKQKAERRAQLVEAVRSEFAGIKLPENQAYVSVKLGAAIWKDDRERAVDLFRRGIEMLIAAQNAAEATKNAVNQNYDLLWSQSLRPNLLGTIAALDAEFALDAFYRSRPAAVQRAVSGAPANGRVSNTMANAVNVAQSEANLEMRLIRLAADQNPERNLAALKELIKKTLTGETFNTLRKVWEKDPAAANELGNDVASRLIAKQFIDSEKRVNYDVIQLANNILSDHIRERTPQQRDLTFEDSRMRSLALKLIALYIDQT
ncbi:MAG TPA: hypothetical protein VNA22_09950, partial [Pyrinomonadaceae bacterium]|nr:hypothetical protein [Pyrinomonadaceae bacterium]